MLFRVLSLSLSLLLFLLFFFWFWFGVSKQTIYKFSNLELYGACFFK